jgi:2'-5' RNA ligase
MNQMKTKPPLSNASLVTADVQRGVMVCLYPPPDVAAQFHVEGGEEQDNMHVTLAYLGKVDELPEGFADTAVSALQSVATAQANLSGDIGGIGRWAAGDDKDCVYASVDVPGANEFRSKVAAALESAGLPVRKDHCWTAHMTIQYCEPGASVRINHVDPVPVTFSSVWVVVGDEDRYEVKFSGSETAPVTSAKAGKKPNGDSYLLDVEAPSIKDHQFAKIAALAGFGRKMPKFLWDRRTKTLETILMHRGSKKPVSLQIRGSYDRPTDGEFHVVVRGLQDRSSNSQHGPWAFDAKVDAVRLMKAVYQQLFAWSRANGDSDFSEED